jgi:hypothetical protein
MKIHIENCFSKSQNNIMQKIKKIFIFSCYNNVENKRGHNINTFSSNDSVICNYYNDVMWQ